jgi:hypothetical protein
LSICPVTTLQVSMNGLQISMLNNYGYNMQHVTESTRSSKTDGNLFA